MNPLNNHTLKFEDRRGLIKSPAINCFISYCYKPLPPVLKKIMNVERKIFDNLKNEARPKM